METPQTNSEKPFDVDGILFSKGTYQIRFVDSIDRLEYWPFIRLDDQGKVKESFCSCSHAICPHISPSLEFLTKKGKPLHVLFESSFFYKMGRDFFLYSQAHPEELLGYREGAFCYGKNFSLQLFSKKMKEVIHSLFDDREVQTEETSLKFNYLSEKELQLFHEGKPSENLQFELSIFRDIAAMLFVKKYIEEPTSNFSFDEKQLPNRFTINFEDSILELYLDQNLIENWCEYFIEFQSNLFVETVQLSSIVYIEEKKEFELHFAKMINQRFSEKAPYEFSSFFYFPREGFVAKSLKEKKVKDVEKFLNEQMLAYQECLKNVEFDDSLHPVQYDLGFTKNYFYIKPYLFKKGDLQKPNSALFNTYAYLPLKGFYRIDAVFQNRKQIKVPLERVVEFVTEYRSFFQEQKGFILHQHQAESTLGYQVMMNGDLRIEPKAYSPDYKIVDLGLFVFVDQMGFFRKGIPTNIGKRAVTKKLVDNFIKSNIDELNLIKNFFLHSSPIEDIGLNIVLKSSQIHINPIISLKTGINTKDIVLYDHYGYIKNQGFFERKKFLPEKYRLKKVISSEQVPFFLRHELKFLISSIRYLDPRCKKISPSNPEIIDIAYLPQRGLWRVQAVFRLGKKRLFASKVAHSFQQQNKIFFTHAGFFDLKESSFSWLSFLEDSFIEQESFFLTTFALLRLLFLGGFEFSDRLSEKKKALVQDLLSFEPKTQPDLTGFRAQLRSYQISGLHWLWFLHERDLSGLLCDDMGLGKTHQVLAFLTALHNLGKKTFLIVCPNSVIYHWEELLKEVLPHLKVCIYHGFRRNLSEDFDVVLTTYGILRRGDVLLNEYFFQLAIFDEMQIAKNGRSQTNKALKALNCKLRIGLSGTPIENCLLELKALFDVALPGFLPKEELYNELFVYPIEKRKDLAQTQLLQQLIRPFLLRRKKTDVLKDLPKKIEQKAHCELLEEQKKLYNLTSDAFYDPVIKVLEDEEKPTPFLSIFALLTKLKMICNHPALYLKDEKNYGKYQSGKWELFKELLHEALGSEQKIVIFTQYLGMLDIIKRYLKSCKIGYASIQGSTQNRAKELRCFKEDLECKVFVGSLRAVGLGVNLTAANVVIHYDRWWNPAWESQATDRVHRIGQKRGVQVFKIVTKETIEEKIDQLIERKRGLMGVVQAEKSSDVIKMFTKTDWIEIIKTLQRIEC